jgi:TRAP-type C4-dicarboxylate transport system permease small subunit
MLRKTLVRMSRVLDRACLTAAVTFFAAVLALVVFQVLARYVFQTVPTWTAEAARYCMVWSGLLGAASAFKADRDPRVLKPPEGGRFGWPAAAGLLRGLAVLVFLGPVLFHSRRFLMRHWDRTAEALGISTFWVTAAVPVAALLIVIHLAARIAVPRGTGADAHSPGEET